MSVIVSLFVCIYISVFFLIASKYAEPFDIYGHYKHSASMTIEKQQTFVKKKETKGQSLKISSLSIRLISPDL